MLVTDPALDTWVSTQANWLHAGAPLLATIAVVGVGKWLARSKPQAQAETIVVDDGQLELEPPPPGYHWVSRPWRVLPNGKREYPQLHGLATFRELRPVSSRLKHRP